MQRKNLRAYEYHFELQVRYCQITMRFPCTFSLHWKLDKNAVSENNRVVPINNQVTFNSALKLTGQMLWNADARQFLEKKSLLTVNLSSQSKPDELKVAGVVNIELSRFINESEFADVDMLYPLERCPDKNSQICVAVSFKKGRQLRMEDLQQSTSLSKIAPELSSIGKAHSIQSSEYLDLKEFQIRVPEVLEEYDDEPDQNKRINSLRTGARKPSTNKPRVSMQPLITEQKEQSDEYETGLRKVRSNERFPSIRTTPNRNENNSQMSRTQSNMLQRTNPNYLISASQQEIPGGISNFDVEVLESLKQANQSLERENDLLKEENTSLKRLNQENSAELQDLHRKMEQLAKNDLSSRKENQLIFMDYNREIERLKKDLAGRESRVEEMTARFNEKEATGGTKLNLQLRDLRQRNKSLEQQVQTLQQTLDEYNVRLADHTTLTNNYYAIEAECNRLQQEFDHSEQQIWDLTLNAKEKDKTLSQLQKTVSELNQHRKSLESDVSCLEEQNNRLKEHIDSLEKQLESEKDNFREQFQEMRQMISRTMSTEDQTLQTIRSLEQECLRMSEILSTRADHIAYFQNRLNELEREVSELNMIRQTTQSILEHSLTEQQQSVRQIEELELCLERSSEQQSERVLPAPGQLDFSRPMMESMNPKKSERSGHKYSNTSWVLKQPEPISARPQDNEVNRLNVIIDVLKLRNQQLTDSLATLKDKHEKLDNQFEKMRASGLSKKYTEATKESDSDDLAKMLSEMIERLKDSSSLLQYFTSMMKSEQPVRQDDYQATLLSQKVVVLNRVRRVSVDLQKFKLGMLKTARGTIQLQQVVSNIKPLQDGIFELLSLDCGIIGSRK